MTISPQEYLRVSLRQHAVIDMVHFVAPAMTVRFGQQRLSTGRENSFASPDKALAAMWGKRQSTPSLPPLYWRHENTG
jgi:hypothetical protein